jgi:simple sugar transport system permease protein
MNDIITLDLLRSSIRLATPIMLAALAAVLSNRAGVFNLALEGKMLLGAFLGILSSFWFSRLVTATLGTDPTQAQMVNARIMGTYLGVVVAALSGALLGAVFTFLYLRYNVDLIILAIALNLFISEMTIFFLRTFFGNVASWSDPSIMQLPEIQLPLIRSIPVLGPLLSGHNAIVYFSWLATALLYVILFHTPFGRHVRAVGENQAAAESLGINVGRVKLFALMLGGALAALGGAFLSVGHLTLFSRDMSNGRGFIGLTAALFGFSHPVGALVTSLFFGFADALGVRLQTTTDIPPSLIQFMPHVLTILALVLVALRSRGQEALARRRFRLRARQQLAGSGD